LVLCLLTSLGLYLIARDLQSLISQRADSLKQSSLAVSQLLHLEQIKNNLKTKDSEDPYVLALNQQLREIQSHLNLAGYLSLIAPRSSQWTVLGSTNSKLAHGDLYPVSKPIQKMLKDGHVEASSFYQQDGSHWINSYAPILGPNNELMAIVSIKSREDALFFRILSFALHYLFIVVSLLGLGSAAFFLWSQRTREKFQMLSEELKQISESSKLAFLLLDSEGRILDGSTTGLDLLQRSKDQVEGQSLFLFETGSQILPLGQEVDKIYKKIRAGERFQFKAKILADSDLVQYVQAQGFQLNKSSRLLLLDVISIQSPKTDIDIDPNSSYIDSQFFDPLTKLPNFNYFRSLLKTHFDSFRFQACSLLLIDLDDFQYFNHLHGQEEGDRLLQEFAKILKNYFRQSDRIIRYREDKFAVILPKTDLQNAARLAQNLSTEIQKSSSDFIRHAFFSVGVSEVTESDKAEDWTNRAIAAMETAKQSGKARVETQRPNEIGL